MCLTVFRRRIVAVTKAGTQATSNEGDVMERIRHLLVAHRAPLMPIGLRSVLEGQLDPEIVAELFEPTGPLLPTVIPG